MEWEVYFFKFNIVLKNDFDKVKFVMSMLVRFFV